jgi:tRNA A37 N6-isopentenylltransferase MiaA
VAETKQLLNVGLANNPTAQALGYETVDYFRSPSLPETIALVKLHRQFAKRQMTWFRRQLPFMDKGGTEMLLKKLSPS